MANILLLCAKRTSSGCIWQNTIQGTCWLIGYYSFSQAPKLCFLRSIYVKNLTLLVADMVCLNSQFTKLWHWRWVTGQQLLYVLLCNFIFCKESIVTAPRKYFWSFQVCHCVIFRYGASCFKETLLRKMWQTSDHNNVKQMRQKMCKKKTGNIRQNNCSYFCSLCTLCCIWFIIKTMSIFSRPFH